MFRTLIVLTAVPMLLGYTVMWASSTKGGYRSPEQAVIAAYGSPSAIPYEEIETSYVDERRQPDRTDCDENDEYHSEFALVHEGHAHSGGVICTTPEGRYVAHLGWGN